MIRHLSGALILTILLVTSVLAHGSKTHVMGTVTKLSDHSMSVTNQDGVFLSILLSPTTVFRTISGEPTDARPVVGSRVVVDIAETREAVRAIEVRFSATHGDSAPGDNTGHVETGTGAEAAGHSHSHHDRPAMQPMGPHD